jgi:hypothetical protein
VDQQLAHGEAARLLAQGQGQFGGSTIHPRAKRVRDDGQWLRGE